MAKRRRWYPPGRTLDELREQVRAWVIAAFGMGVFSDSRERGYRVLEESLELAQSVGVTENEALGLVEYVFGREPGTTTEEAGDLLVALSALAAAEEVGLEIAVTNTLHRNWLNIEKIRAKHVGKKVRGPLHGDYPNA